MSRGPAEQRTRFVVVPTYNEAGNIKPLLDRMLSLGIEHLRVLVVDDASPDGTAGAVASYAGARDDVILVERRGMRGRGTAGATGFELAMRFGADEIVEMDADLSHPPEDLPRLFAGLRDADIVVASRLAPGAIDVRPFFRRFITVLANHYARFFMETSAHRSRVRDWTTGFRAYRRVVFEKVPPASLVSQGPSIVQEVLFRALNLGCSAAEIPFRMIDRAAGRSSFSRRVAVQSLLSIPAYRVLFSPAAAPALPFRSEPERVADRHYILRIGAE